MSNNNEINIEWEALKLAANLQVTYLDLSLKLNMFYYAITGAIISFHFSSGEGALTRFGLMLPLLLSIGLAIFFLFASILAYQLEQALKIHADALGLKLYPSGLVLVITCMIFSINFFIVSIVLTWYLFIR